MHLRCRVRQLAEGSKGQGCDSGSRKEEEANSGRESRKDGRIGGWMGDSSRGVKEVPQGVKAQVMVQAVEQPKSKMQELRQFYERGVGIEVREVSG